MKQLFGPMLVCYMDVISLCQSLFKINLSFVNQSLIIMPKNCFQKESSKNLLNYMVIIMCKRFTKEPMLQSDTIVIKIEKQK